MKETKTVVGLMPFIICTVVFMTCISQMPYLVESALTHYITYPIWICLMLGAVLKNPMLSLHKSKGFWMLVLLFLAYLVITCIFTGSFFTSSIDKSVCMAAFIFMVGICCGRLIEFQTIEKICDAFIWATLIVCGSVFIEYIAGSDLSGPEYLYGSKNSVSQILLTAWILIFFIKLPRQRKRVVKLFLFAALILLTWTMLGLRSRATLFGFPIIVIWTVLNGKYNRKVRNTVVIMTVAITIFFVANENIWNSFMNNIIFAGRQAGNLDSISSGRANEWTNFFADFAQNGFLGNGYDKRESVFLSAFLQHGIVGGAVITAMVFYPFLWFRKNVQKGNLYYIPMTLTALVYIVNGVFEQQAPFGPGVKCFFLWFIMGVFSTLGKTKSEVTISG